MRPIIIAIKGTASYDPETQRGLIEFFPDPSAPQPTEPPTPTTPPDGRRGRPKAA